MKKEIIKNIEEAFIHDVRKILTDKNLTSDDKVIKLVLSLDMYQTIKDMQQIWPESRKIVETMIEDYNAKVGEK